MYNVIQENIQNVKCKTLDSKKFVV